MIVKLPPNGSTEQIKTAILKVLKAVGKATASEIADEIECEKYDRQRIKSTVYSLSGKQYPAIKRTGDYPIRFVITPIGEGYLNGNKQWQGATATTKVSDEDGNDLPHIPNYVYNMAKENGLTTGEMMFYLWGRSQMKSTSFKFTDQGAATMLCCNVNTIRNYKRTLKDLGLLECSEQARQGGKFGASTWIFHRTPQRQAPPPDPPTADDNDPLPF